MALGKNRRISAPNRLTVEALETRYLLTALLSDDIEVSGDQVFSGELVERVDHWNAIYDVGQFSLHRIATPPLRQYVEGPLTEADLALVQHAIPTPNAAPTDQDAVKLAFAEAADPIEFTPNGIPLLHSMPGAPAIVYLDFDGNFEPSWGGNTNVVTPPYDLDGDGESFNDEESRRIIETWYRVSEDFAPFNIDVTTEDPSDAKTVLRQVVDTETNRIRTFYFRHNFNVNDPSTIDNLTVELLRDDGAAVYLNGREIVRDNLPAGANFDTLAIDSVGGEEEDTYFPFDVPSSFLVAGNNVLAVEVHQESDTSSDVSFDLALVGHVAGTRQDLVAAGSQWQFLQDGSNQGTAWRASDFDTADWETGRAQFGYGESDEITTLNVFDGDQPRVRTYYFRTEFDVTDVDAIENLALRLLRDDGAAVYLNGVEIRRDNLPADATFADFALSSVGGADESRYFNSLVEPGLLVPGRNVLAVEVHQHSDTSSDVSFDLQLEAQLADGPRDLVSQRSRLALPRQW